MGKIPYVQFYPGDWLRDNISSCSLAAQGLWLRMMIVGHDSDRYGYLEMNGIAMQRESIARRVGCSLAEFDALLSELDAAGVPSRTPEGIIFSRRMVRDASAREASALRQAKFRRKRNAVSNGVSNGRVTLNNEVEDESDKEDLSSLKTKVEKLYQEYPKHVGRAAALKAIRKALAKETYEVLIEAVQAYAATRSGQEAKFTPHPATWFNEERWKDDRNEWKPRTGRTGPGQQYQPEKPAPPTLGSF